MTAQRADQKQTPTTTGPELIARARALAPLLASHDAEAERLRKPVDTVMPALEEAEIFKLMAPRPAAFPGTPRGSRPFRIADQARPQSLRADASGACRGGSPGSGIADTGRDRRCLRATQYRHPARPCALGDAIRRRGRPLQASGADRGRGERGARAFSHTPPPARATRPQHNLLSCGF